jgi:short-subunit dehydrogenase
MPSGSSRKVAVVTGGTAGVGRAVVRQLAGAGYDVAVLARGRAGLEGATKEVESVGCKALAAQVDVADAEAVDWAAGQVEATLGEIDVWVNAAFAGSLAFAWDTSVEQLRRITEVTYYGQVHGTLAALQRMRPRGRGVIVSVGSAMAFRSIPLQAAYCAAKHAVKGYHESVLTELKHEKSNVKICQVQLPGLNTPQFNWNTSKMSGHPRPVAPVFQPELAAKAVVFVAEHPRRSMWVGISTAYTILGGRLAPRFLDWYLARTGVSGQQTHEPLPRWGENLFEPQDDLEDRGAHGPFDEQAHDADPVLWVSRHRRAVLVATGTLAAAASALVARRGPE